MAALESAIWPARRHSGIIRPVEHLKIAYYFAVLLVGTAAIVYAVLMSRSYRLPFLKPLVWFLVFNNVIALINLTSAYACANLLGFCALGRYTVLSGILGPAARLSEAGIIYALIAIGRGFSGKRISKTFNRWYAAAAGFISQNAYLYCASEGLATVVRGSVERIFARVRYSSTSDGISWRPFRRSRTSMSVE